MIQRTVEFHFGGHPVAVDVEFRGLFGGSTADGHRIDVLESVLQKVVRRADLPRAVGAAVRLAAFDHLGHDGARAAGVTTNLLNRVVVIAAEDVGPGNPRLMPRVEALMDRLRRQRDEARASGTPADIGTGLVEVLGLLCASPKSRLVSHARATFGRGIDLGLAPSRVPFLADALAEVERAGTAAVPGVDADWEEEDRANLRQFAWVLRHGHALPGARLTRFLGVRYLVALQASPSRYPVLRGHPPRVRRGSPAHAVPGPDPAPRGRVRPGRHRGHLPALVRGRVGAPFLPPSGLLDGGGGGAAGGAQSVVAELEALVAGLAVGSRSRHVLAAEGLGE